MSLAVTRGRRSAGRIVRAWTHRSSYMWLDPEELDDREIRRIAQPVYESTFEVEGYAELAVEPDSERVGVFFLGVLVGYLKPLDGEPYAQPLTTHAMSGVRIEVPFQGHWQRLDPRVYAGLRDLNTAYLRLDVPPPTLMVPLNTPPLAKHIVLPPGGRMSVTGEENHMENISRWVSHDGGSAVYASMHVVDVKRPRSTVQLVEVRVDGMPVGTLTQRMSDQAKTIVDVLEAAGITTVCRASVEGNSLAADVNIYPIRRENITNAWLNEAMSNAGRIRPR